MAREGSDAIQTLALALKFRMTSVALGATIFPYPTTVEGLKLAAQIFDKDVTKLSCWAGLGATHGADVRFHLANDCQS